MLMQIFFFFFFSVFSQFYMGASLWMSRFSKASYTYRGGVHLSSQPPSIAASEERGNLKQLLKPPMKRLPKPLLKLLPKVKGHRD